MKRLECGRTDRGMQMRVGAVAIISVGMIVLMLKLLGSRNQSDWIGHADVSDSYWINRLRSQAVKERSDAIHSLIGSLKAGGLDGVAQNAALLLVTYGRMEETAPELAKALRSSNLRLRKNVAVALGF